MARRAMRVAIETDTRGFVMGMNKAGKSIEDMRSTVGGSAMAIKNLGTSLDGLTGNALGLSAISSQMGKIGMLTKGVHQGFTALKNISFSGLIAGMRGVTTSTTGATAATHGLTAATVAYQAVATLGIAAAIAGIVAFVSHIGKQREEMERLREEENKLMQDRMQAEQNEHKTWMDRVNRLTSVPLTKEQEIIKMIDERTKKEKEYQKALKNRDSIERALKSGHTAMGYTVANLAEAKQTVSRLETELKESEVLDTALLEEQKRILEQQKKLQNDETRKRLKAEDDIMKKRASFIEGEQEKYAKYTKTQEELITAEIKKRQDAYKNYVKELAKTGVRIGAEERKMVLEGIAKDVREQMTSQERQMKQPEMQQANVEAIMRGSMEDYRARMATTDPRVQLVEEQNKQLREQNRMLAAALPVLVQAAQNINQVA